MATYKFPDYHIELTDPVITVDLNSIRDRALAKLLSVDVYFITPTASFGTTAIDMPYETWDDPDIENMVQNWLKQFEI